MLGFNAGCGSISRFIVGGRVHYAPGVAVGFGWAWSQRTQIHTGPVVNPGPYSAPSASLRCVSAHSSKIAVAFETKRRAKRIRGLSIFVSVRKISVVCFL